MEKPKQIDVFSDELDKVVEKLSFELDLTNAELVGTLVIKVGQIIIKALTVK